MGIVCDPRCGREGENQFWSGGVCYGADHGEHLVVAIHQMVMVIGRLRLERLLIAK